MMNGITALRFDGGTSKQSKTPKAALWQLLVLAGAPIGSWHGDGNHSTQK
jgi:hypothetical protein